jgi:hypothetical protein
MTRLLWLLLGMACMGLLLRPAPAAVAMPALPAPRVHTSPLRADPAPLSVDPIPPAPSVRPQPALNPSTAVGPLGWAGRVECWNCAPFTATARVTHYDPMLGDINCWDWDEEQKYCYSPTFIGVHWKAVYGLAAACPVEWKIGTWVVLPEGQGAYICLDRGDQVTCGENGVCAVDILGPGGAAWDGQTMTVSLWVPLDPPRGE